MILNIIDDRKRPYRWRCINARAEPTENDNSCQDADQATVQENVSVYEELIGVPITEAVDWAHSIPYWVTLYIGDKDDHLDPDEP